jgi:hypothetical protein
MKIEKVKTLFLVWVVLAVLLSTFGCVNILSFQSKVEIIGQGQGIQAAGFKMGTYTDFSKEPKPIKIKWDGKRNEYEIYFENSKANNFRLMHLRKKNYLLQAHNDNEDHYEYAIIKIEGDIVDFLNIKEDYQKKLESLKKKYNLITNEEDIVMGTRKNLISFFKKLAKAKYLESGERIRYIEGNKKTVSK